MKKSYIYALVCPTTHVVKYVGQAINIDARYRHHWSGKDITTGEWVRKLKAPPFLLILEVVERKRIPAPGCIDKTIEASTYAETKWIKRFRRTVFNARTRLNSVDTWEYLVNPDEVSAPVEE